MKSRHWHRAASLCGCTCALLLAAAGAFAQGVTKCIDAGGNVTYQDSPCTGGQAGRSVDLPKAETREDTSAWEAAARDARVIRGMPKRWVLRARGAPLEIRVPTTREDASEVWRYSAKEGVMLVGFAGGNVTWVRDEVAPRTAAASASAAAPSGPRGAENRRFVIAGRACEYVFAEIGAADREEPLASPAPGTATQSAGPGSRYIYEPQPGDPRMRTVFSCVGGKVADVERTVVQ